MNQFTDFAKKTTDKPAALSKTKTGRVSKPKAAAKPKAATAKKPAAKKAAPKKAAPKKADAAA